ncbi:HAMP domain-containing histidine kinase [Belliella sp. DSM 111904]|uniref:histidine kinase n=1 Tax=Belliella filtrata TaxID=2923435 RepID=A0ABS9V5E4_9BACT|nr:HAMP domain-containing sensor histidine kinase [Belliella filtrata]MCH7411637.1 HAMP domain-containing histidine kinase [Belliella filtrata]
MKLLNKSLKPFTLLTFVLLIISIPLFYFVVLYIYILDADQTLASKKVQIEDQLNHLYKIPKTAILRIRLLNELDIGYQIYDLDTMSYQSEGDRFYTAERFDQYSNSIKPYRYLESELDIFGVRYLLKAEVDMEEYFDVIPYTTLVASIFFLLILIGYYMINRFVARKVWKPFYKILNELSSLKIQNGEKLSPIDSDIDEFIKLSDNLLYFTNRSYSAYNQQKEFTENAAHELQTPLAIIQSKAELLLQTELTGSQHEYLSQINLAVSRMKRLNKNLLMLAKIENKQFIINEKLNLSAILLETIDLYQSSFDTKSIRVYTEIEEEVYIKGNRALIETLINSLFTNAISHNLDFGRMNLILNRKNLLIQNSGKLIPLDSEKIFKRFNKENISFSGSGLGLAICKEIVILHDFKIKYKYINGLHSFKLWDFE